MVRQQAIWIDKNAYYPLIAVPVVFVLLFMVGVWGRRLSAIEFTMLALFYVAGLLFFIGSSANRPLRIVKEGLIIGKKWSFFPVFVPFKEIQRISIKFGIVGKYNETLLIEDKAGNRYLNVIYGGRNFKKVLLSLKAQIPAISDESWYRHLPHKLR